MTSPRRKKINSKRDYAIELYLRDLEMPKRKETDLREFWIIESEYGWDVKRYVVSVERNEESAKKKVEYLDVKDPQDKHTIFHVREVRKK